MDCKLQGISKRYADHWVIKDVDLHLPSGSRTAILGSNGSGKSTLLRIIAGQLSSTSGHIDYTADDQKVAEEEVFSHLGFVAPYVDLYRKLTFAESLDFHFSLRSIRSGLSLSDVLTSIAVPSDKPLSAFSSGMLQRVKLTLAFHTKSSLLLLDEPSMNLDEEGIAWYHHQLDKLPKETTVVVATNEAHTEALGIDRRFSIADKRLQVI